MQAEVRHVLAPTSQISQRLSTDRERYAHIRDRAARYTSAWVRDDQPPSARGLLRPWPVDREHETLEGDLPRGGGGSREMRLPLVRRRNFVQPLEVPSAAGNAWEMMVGRNWAATRAKQCKTPRDVEHS